MHLESVTCRIDLFPDASIYPFNLRCFSTPRAISLDAPAVMFVGENGSGKSTVLEAIARRAHIHIWRGFRRARHQKRPYEEQLYRFLTLKWRNGTVPGAFFASELFKDFSQLIDEWAESDPGLLEYFGRESLLKLSHGQGHMAFFRNRFFRRGLYLLDEPENALSPTTQLELLDLLTEAIERHEAQFIIATHSPLILSLPAAQIIDFDTPDLSSVRFEDTTHVQVYRSFFERWFGSK